MPINLTVPFPLSNGTRLVVSRVKPDEDEGFMSMTVSMRTATGGNPPDSEVSGKQLVVRNGMCDRLSRAVPVAGGRHADVLVVTERVLNLPSGFTNAFAAYKTSKAALETHLLSVGIIDSTLAGT